ncbi:IS21-like element helper ATPase IstB [Haliangium sp. UPWRP_2]|uniref:IS21-like element helper ATPase IstB n=1 Tax=Haliangium sp. UPWRP_2 TaxID=1931276 RepID=UPI000B539250|nr:IS21-like element helper ATPase IstB [Haliangium sp. UPWRP_2]PSM31256.1 AAA family ATPase [Haliangium sp. UPWRP_2]
MLTTPTLDKLRALKLDALADAFCEQQRNPHVAALSFEERLGLLVDAQHLALHNKRIARAQREAKLRIHSASLAAIDAPEKRNLDRALLAQLGSGAYIREHLCVLITGATGTGKTFVACALGDQACTQGFRVLYLRLPRLLEELHLARADGTYPRLLARLLRTDLLILDDWGLGSLGEAQSRDLLEVLEDREGRRATVVASQLPVEHWHKWLADPTVADAILDRLVHRSYRLVLKGPSKRKDAKPITP